MIDLILIGTTLLFFAGCFGLVAFFNSLTRGE